MAILVKDLGCWELVDCADCDNYCCSRHREDVDCCTNGHICNKCNKIDYYIAELRQSQKQYTKAILELNNIMHNMVKYSLEHHLILIVLLLLNIS